MNVVLSHGWRPGIVGEIVGAHGVYYAKNWGFGAFFEAKVAQDVGAFLNRYDPKLDLLLTASSEDGQFLGGLAVDGSDPALAGGVAHLRWFLATEGARGAGLGGRMMNQAMAFMGDADFARCYLTTFAGLDAARRLYERHGFRLVAEANGASWGVDIVEQQFEALVNVAD